MGYTIYGLLIIGLTVSLLAFASVYYMSGWGSVYNTTVADNTTNTSLNALDVSDYMNDTMIGEGQDKIVSGNILDTIWNSLQIFGHSIDVFKSITVSSISILNLPIGLKLQTIILLIVTVVVIWGVIRAITKVRA